MRILILIILTLGLAACGGSSNNNTNNENTSNTTSLSVIQWDRSPSNIIFRAQVMGGEDADAIYRLSEVPDCTIYGDGRIVWSLSVEAGTQILFDTLDDLTIQRFITDLTVEQQFFSYEAEADLQVPSSIIPVYEQITVNVNDLSHTTDSLADWEPNYYVNIMNMCQNLSATPTIYEPTAVWVSVRPAEFQNGVPVIFWDSEAAGVNIQALAASGEREWVTSNIARILWRLIRQNSYDLLFADETGNYQMAVEVPNITISSPPAP